MHDNIKDIERYKIINDEHVLDIKTGVEYHLYDDYFKITYGDDKIAKMNDFTLDEQEIIWKIKQLITDPEKVKQRLEEYPTLVKQRREKLSELYENPNPTSTKIVVEEVDTEVYTG